MPKQLKEDKSLKIKRIEIEPLEKGFLYTVCADKESDSKDMCSNYQQFKYSLSSVEEIAAAIKDDLESPHARKAEGGSGGYKKMAGILSRGK